MSDLYLSEGRFVGGREVVVHWHSDDLGPPWSEHDGHGPVREGARHSHHGNKKPCERPLNRADSRSSQYYYDWQEAMKIAKRDGWGLGIDTFMGLMCTHRRVPTKGMVAEAAVQGDFDYLAGWVNDDWDWCWINVTDCETGISRNCGGFESTDTTGHDSYIENAVEEMHQDVVWAILSGDFAPFEAAA